MKTVHFNDPNGQKVEVPAADAEHFLNKKGWTKLGEGEVGDPEPEPFDEDGKREEYRAMAKDWPSFQEYATKRGVSAKGRKKNEIIADLIAADKEEKNDA